MSTTERHEISTEAWLEDILTVADIVLPPPILYSPENQWADYKVAEFAFDPITVRLEWSAVPGADFYVVQWCMNSSFRGPTLVGRRTTDTYLDIQENDELLRTTDIWYYWRVFAYSNTGGVSDSSEVWQFGLFWDHAQMGISGCVYVDWQEPVVTPLTPGNRLSPCVIALKFDMDGASILSVEWDARYEHIMGDPIDADKNFGIVLFDHLDPNHESYYVRQLVIDGRPTWGRALPFSPQSYYLIRVKITHDRGVCYKSFRIPVGEPPEQGVFHIQIANGATKAKGLVLVGDNVFLRVGKSKVNVPKQDIESGSGFLMATVSKAGGNTGIVTFEGFAWENELPDLWDPTTKKIKILIGAGTVTEDGIQKTFSAAVKR